MEIEIRKIFDNSEVISLHEAAEKGNIKIFQWHMQQTGLMINEQFISQLIKKSRTSAKHFTVLELLAKSNKFRHS